MSDQTFLAYWLGFIPGNSSLEETPAGVTHVALAFAVTGPTSNGDGITIDFLTRDHSEEEIRAGAKALQARGVKVLMSINGDPNWDGHPGGWTNLDAPVFAANVKALAIDDWGLDGVDLDNEANEVPGEDFVAAVQALRSAMGPDPLLTLPVYVGAGRDSYLSQVKDDISFVSTMAYWNGLEGQIDLYNEYAGLVGEQKVAMGVGNAANPGQNTPFDQVAPIAAWNPSDASKAGVMLWNLNSPEPDETALWCQTIAENLP
jgi:chitinase